MIYVDSNFLSGFFFTKSLAIFIKFELSGAAKAQNKLLTLRFEMARPVNGHNIWEFWKWSQQRL